MKILIIYTTIILLHINAMAQNRNADSTKTLPEAIVISGSKYEEKKKNIVQSITTITKKEIEQSNAGNSGDLLERNGSVFVQRSQQGGSSPVLRGFEANRVLLVVDGVRMNNAIYRGGHLQNVITLDPNMLQSVEVLFGSSSTLFGSDALGGVMNFRTKDPLFSKTDDIKVDANAFLRFSSANTGLGTHLDFSLAGQKFGSTTSFTANRFGDLVSGKNRNSKYGDWGLRKTYIERINGIDSIVTNSNPYLQIGSGYNQYDVLQKFVYKPSDKTIHRLNIQYSTSSDIPRYDRLTDTALGGKLSNAEWYYGPQNRLLTSYEIQKRKMKGFFNEANAIFSYQQIEESRNTRARNNANLTSRVENLDVLGYDINARHKGNKNELIIGTDAQLNRVESKASRLNINTSEITAASTRYPDGGSKLNMFALYLQDIYKINPNWVLNGGLRFSGNSLLSKFVDTTFYKFPYREASQKSNALTGNIGIIYLDNGLRVATGINTGFRMPNVDDMTKIFDTKPGSFVVIPNANLKPEHTTNFDLSIGYSIGQYGIELSGFYTDLRNAMVLRADKFNGLDSIIYDGVLTQVQTMQNAAKGKVFGSSIVAFAKINKLFSAKLNYTITDGTYTTFNSTTNVPLDHIPPAFGRIGLMYDKTKYYAELYSHFCGKKDITDYSPSGEDNAQYATTTGVPSWATLNLRLGYKVNEKVGLQFAVENITDIHYRNFASGISAPGRNFVITLRGGI